MCRVIGKVVHPYSGTVVVGTTSGRNAWRWCCCGRGVSWTNGGGGKVTYVGGWMKCMVLKEDIGLKKVRSKVKGITGNPCADFDANYEGDIVEVEYLLLSHIGLQSTDVPNSHILLHCAHIGLLAVSTPQPCLCVNHQVQFWMFLTIRQPEMFTREEANVHRGKQRSTTDKPVGNCHTAVLPL
ncbi:hypothetical protein Cgig2_012252 [Carnegiea gigantea]|uniref:Uncharacterized protein n=1 Tax=Carnegiea gigantea TaxID=171969 RepID=A0A9Q1Q3V6_9CARY|nr:hypothetical protein Cgig2_012252 [Carnegiea gigantea]